MVTMASVVRLAAACALFMVGHAAAAQSTPAAAADSTAIHEIRLSDGSVLYGRIVQRDSARIVVRTINGASVELRPALVKQLRVTAGRVVGDEFWVEDPNHTRLLFTSTGRALRQGEGYLSAYFLFVPMLAYGVTDRVTIAGGTPILPGAMGKAFYIAPKVLVHETPRSAYSIGALSFALTEAIDEGTVGIAYGVGTWGSRDRAVTAGAGWGYAWGGDDGAVSNSPVIALGFENRLSRRTKFITENWIFTGDGGAGAAVSGAFRFIGDRLTADLGAIGLAGGDDGACCVPMVNFVWNFGRR
jgi:hypothetical protein